MAENTSEGTLTKIDLVNNLHDRLGLSKTQCADIVDLLFEEMKKCLTRGEDLKLSGFGNFEIRQKKERKGRNPKTGNSMMLPPRRVVTFKISNLLKELVNKSVKSE